MDALTVGQLAERSGVPATTLRYYDSIGLLVPRRLPNGHRRYPVEALEQLQLVKAARSLGLSLQEVATVLGPAGGNARREVAARKLAELDHTLQRLAAVRAVLAHVAACGHGPDDGGACRADVRAAWQAAAVSPAG